MGYFYDLKKNENYEFTILKIFAEILLSLWYSMCSRVSSFFDRICMLHLLSIQLYTCTDSTNNILLTVLLFS